MPTESSAEKPAPIPIKKYDDFPMLDAFKIRILFGPAIPDCTQGILILTKGTLKTAKEEKDFYTVIWGQEPNTYVDVEVYNNPNLGDSPDFPESGFIRLSHVWVDKNQQPAENLYGNAMIKRILDDNTVQYYCNQGDNEKYSDFTFEVSRFVWVESYKGKNK